jgi:enoyl-CoA hydratase
MAAGVARAEVSNVSVVLTEPATHVGLLTLDRPACLNALDEKALDRLFETLEQLEHDLHFRAVVLTGAGRGFCAGHDRRDTGRPGWVPEGAEGSYLRLLLHRRWSQLVPRVRRLPQPVIAAVNGPAVGGGFVLAMAGDLRLAARSAFFEPAFHAYGMSGAEFGLGWLLQRAAGAQRAAEVVLTGRRIGAEEAAEWGLVLAAVADEELADRALETAGRIVRHNPMANWMGKAGLWASLESPGLEAAIELEARAQMLSLATDDAAETVASAADRRAPDYRLR